MGFDGFLVPDWAKPYVGWVVGMDWPKGDETGCFRLADACVAAAYRLVEGTSADQPWSAEKVGSAWDGEAHLTFAAHVKKVAGGQVAALVNRLVNTAVALNGVGVQIQYAKYMIEVTVWLLIAQLAYLLAAAMASGGASLALIGPRVQIARMTVRQIAKRCLLNIALFAGIVAGMDAGVQILQMAKGRRDELDFRQLAVSALSGGAMGGLMGLLSGGLTRLATPALRAGLTRAEMTTAERLLAAASSSLYGQAAQYALTGGLTTAGTMLAEGNFSWDLLAKGITSSALGADGQHLTTALPRTGDGPSPHLPAPDTDLPPAPPARSPSPDTDPPSAPGDTTPSATPSQATGTPPHPTDPGQPAHPTSGQSTHPDPGQSTRPGPDAEPATRPDQSTSLSRAPESPATEAPRQPAESPRQATLPDGEPSRPTPSTAPQPMAPHTAAPHTAPQQAPGSHPAPQQGPAAHATDRTTAEPPQRPRPGEQSTAPPARPAPDRTDAASPRPPLDEGPTPAQADPKAGPGRADAGPGRADAGPGRIEGLLNHHQDVPGDPAPRSDAPVAADRGGDGPVAPARTTYEGDAAGVPEQAGERGSGSRVPFDFERFYNDPRWAAEAGRFEQRLGAYYFNNPQTVDAARTALSRLRDVLMDLTPRRPDERPADFAQRVESVFFKDDPASAGQVGTRGVTVDDLLAHGNLRELMTAFYNAAYYNRANPHIFGNALLNVMDTGAWDRARAAGLDVDAVRRAQHQLDERLHRPLLGSLEERFMTGSFTFTRDPFGTGNVGMLSERGARDVAEMVSSQHARRDRTDAEIQRLNTTPRHYDDLGTPLGRFERAHVEESIGNRRLEPDTPLPWREGITAHDTASSRWARQVAGDGYPVIDGVSGTTAKMLTAAKFLNLGPGANERFLGAIMGWMLPGRDHSLFEIYRGAQIADVGGMRLEPGARPTAVDFYRGLPGLDLTTLRQEILPDGMFPHESRYLANATDPAGFSETRHPKVGDIRDRLWPQLETGRVTDPDLASWLHRNGIDPTDPAQVRALGERLSPAHVTALTVYTRHSHYLINNVTRTQLWTAGVSESVVRHRMADKVNQLVGDYLDNLAAGTKALPLPMDLRPLLHVGDGHLDSTSPLNRLAESYVDAVRRTEEARQRVEEGHSREAGKELREARRDAREAFNEIKRRLGQVTPRLFDEMRWHADMVHDAMTQLPAVGSAADPVRAYRGDWLTRVHSPIYGSKLHPYGTAREFLSVSTLMEVALRFMAENPAGNRKVLAVYELTGQQARDISVFSSFAVDEEAVFPPHSRTRRVEDPELAASVRAEADRLIADMVRRGVIPEPPGPYEIIIMEEPT